MTDTRQIGVDLLAALAGTLPLSADLYDEVLADHETHLAASLNKDADDALLCRLADQGDVAMVVIDWDSKVYRNVDALKKLRAMWPHSLDVAGIKWSVQIPN